ncbi:MAG: hypothetical protein HY819_18420 [Acidobacteria bacterium]|nr:hypothetical protein [Acidobacteriota bacterium]
MEQTIEQFILSDLKERFDLPAEKISVSSLHPANFPSDAKLFRAEKKGSYGNIYYNYIQVNGKFYCSLDEDSFSKLLSTEKILTRPRWNAHQLAALFLHLVVRDLRLVESSSDVNKTADETFNQKVEKISPPSLNITSAKAELRFWTFQVRYQKLEFWDVSITSSYQMAYKRN